MRSLFLLCFYICFLNAEILLVTNRFSDFNTLSKESIKYLYLGKVNKIDDIKIEPLLSQDKKLHKEFVNKVIDKNLSQYDSYWARLVFTGRKGIPKRLKKQEIEKELTQINTIIYIKKEQYDTKWKIIYEEN